jgi:hypothetical protein
VDVEIERLRGAIREFGAPSDVQPGEAGWQDVAVWFGSLLMLGPARLRGVGAFASVALVSRVWSRRQFRVEDRMRHVLRATLDLLAEDLEDRAAQEDALEEAVASLRSVAGELGSHTGWHAEHDADVEQRLTNLEVRAADDAEAAEAEERRDSPDCHVALTGLQDYLDDTIRRWRTLRDANDDPVDKVMAVHYIDAFQAVRDSIIGATLPEAEGPQSDEEAGRPGVPRELKLVTTRISELLARSGGSIGVRYEPGDQPDMRWSVMGMLGREAEDSPMAGGAVHGLGATMIDALDQALREARA